MRAAQYERNVPFIQRACNVLALRTFNLLETSCDRFPDFCLITRFTRVVYRSSLSLKLSSIQC
eukprot:6202113-Pleurochrysis_carterae.AAC.2